MASPNLRQKGLPNMSIYAEAGLSIVQTLFICFAVGVGAMTFSKDANELLLNPIATWNKRDQESSPGWS